MSPDVEITLSAARSALLPSERLTAWEAQERDNALICLDWAEEAPDTETRLKWLRHAERHIHRIGWDSPEVTAAREREEGIR